MAGYVGRQFRRARGESLYRYLMMRRCDRARALLREAGCRSGTTS